MSIAINYKSNPNFLFIYELSPCNSCVHNTRNEQIKWTIHNLHTGFVHSRAIANAISLIYNIIDKKNKQINKYNWLITWEYHFNSLFQLTIKFLSRICIILNLNNYIEYIIWTSKTCTLVFSVCLLTFICPPFFYLFNGFFVAPQPM